MGGQASHSDGQVRPIRERGRVDLALSDEGVQGAAPHDLLQTCLLVNAG